MQKKPMIFFLPKIEDIARGAMIASAIYIDTSNTPAFVKERRLTNLSVYLDTAFVLSALDYKRADQKKSCRYTIRYAPRKWSQLVYFSTA